MNAFDDLTLISVSQISSFLFSAVILFLSVLSALSPFIQDPLSLYLALCCKTLYTILMPLLMCVHYNHFFSKLNAPTITPVLFFSMIDTLLPNSYFMCFSFADALYRWFIYAVYLILFVFLLTQYSFV